MRQTASGGKYYLLILLVAFFACQNQNVLALTASIGPDGCNAQAVHSLGFTGQGIVVGVLSEAHARVSHEAFFDKDAQGYPTGTSYANWFDATDDTTPYEPDWHDTAMAGIVGSRGGRLYPVEIGVAPDCEIYSIKITHVSELDPNERVVNIAWIKAGLEELLDQGGRVAVTGIQFPSSSVTPNGSSQYTLIYDYYAYDQDMIFINAAGNDSSKVTVFGDGYNGITTGGLIMPETGVYRQVGTASNPGPTVDGRRKPEIMAPAQTLRVPSSSSDTIWAIRGTTRGETSWAGPHAAGVAALLVQYANSSAEASDGKSVVIKAVMVNSTFPNVKTETGQITTGLTWHAQRGYGRVDALRAYQLLSQPKITKSTYITQSAGWAYHYINQSNQLDTYWIYGNKNQRLVLTVTWHRAAVRVGPSSSNTYADEAAPKFNLNLSIYDPQTNLVFSDADTPDNLRKADVLLQSDGYYQICVANSTTKTGRYYAMAFELLDPIGGDFNIDYIVDSNDLVAPVGYWLADNCADSGQACHIYDLTADGQIDFQDMAILSAEWLMIDPRYYPVP